MDSRIRCDYRELVSLRQQASRFNFLPRLKAGSPLSGRHGSKFRGRGLNFEELRNYRAGDDIRTLDWKVTLRTGRPHVRTFTEEKDRNVVIFVDQRASMFFSSVDTMKSVAAVHLAALCGWKVISDNDRVGYYIFNDEKSEWLAPQRSQGHIFRSLQVLANYNQALSAETEIPSKANTLEATIDKASRMNLKGATLVFISDWLDATETVLNKLKKLQQRNDVLTVVVSDPMEQKLPRNIKFMVSDGENQLMLDSSNAQLSSGIIEHYLLKKEQLKKLLAVKKLPLIEIDTSGEHVQQFCATIGI